MTDLAATPAIAVLRCFSCGETCTIPPAALRCRACGEGLLVREGPAPVVADDRPGAGVWRYAASLPAVAEADRVTLGEGGTPLLRMSTLGGYWLKNEGVNPTGSYKDRFNAVNVSVARSLGYAGISLTSTGNAGLSAATYGARAGLQVRVYCPPETPQLIVSAIAATGASVRRCAPSETAARVAADVAEGFFPGSRAVPATNATPFGAEGYRSIAYEIVADLGTAPDAVYLPVGGGDGLYGVHQGMVDLYHAGVIEGIPRMMAARTTAPVALSIARDDVGAHAECAVRETGGAYVQVSERDILRAVGELNRGGVSAEPASAASVAAVAHRLEPEGSTVVCVLTGHGLKWAPAGA